MNALGEPGSRLHNVLMKNPKFKAAKAQLEMKKGPPGGDGQGDGDKGGKKDGGGDGGANMV